MKNICSSEVEPNLPIPMMGGKKYETENIINYHFVRKKKGLHWKFWRASTINILKSVSHNCRLQMQWGDWVLSFLFTEFPDCGSQQVVLDSISRQSSHLQTHFSKMFEKVRVSVSIWITAIAGFRCLPPIQTILNNKYCPIFKKNSYKDIY